MLTQMRVSSGMTMEQKRKANFLEDRSRQW
uniref:Uncharacterized protein n=1 Tax=Anguilla anguilla TaxID=7936 RepID=A0A0E9TTQ2_ANGAN